MKLPDSPPSSESTERLIGALQGCFSDLLRTQKAQTDKLHKAVEALQQKPPVADKKNIFWKQYQSLADEHDKELLQKFSTDLDTSLIFAGLFSAVSSAFIIQIQPQIHPDGTLALILVAQCLLVFSLFSTLLAALLAVLGKQWLMYYSAAGERGTIEARGLERQRKFDGLQRWKFSTVMHLFPLLLQLALLLFSAGLSVYLWTVHISLAIIVLLSTSGGFSAYVFLLMTSVVSPDSPFQNPLAPFLAMIVPLTVLGRLQEYFGRAITRSGRFVARGWSFFPAYLQKPSHILPHFFARERPLSPPPHRKIAPLFRGAFPAPSPEAPAVAWILETSTDPLIIASAADVAVDLRWPVDTDFAAPLARLRDSFLACFELAEVGYENYPRGVAWPVPLKSVRAGMAARAITYGRAYCVLRLAHKSSGVNDDSALEVINHIPVGESPLLLQVVWILQGAPNLAVGSDAGAAAAVRWALRVIPSLNRKSDHSLDQFLQGFRTAGTAVPHLDASSFADYLICLNSFFSTINSQDMGLVDKSPLKDSLMLWLLQTLSARLLAGQIDMPILTLILETTSRLSSQFENTDWYSGRIVHKSTKERKTAVYRLCRIIHDHAPGSFAAITAAARLASVDTRYVHVSFSRGDAQILGGDAWVHVVLEEVQHSNSGEWNGHILAMVESLLQALLFYPGDHTQNIPVVTFQTILRALSIPGPISRTAFLLLSRSKSWFEDARLWQIIQLSSLWFDLGRIGVEGPESLRAGYIDLGHTLAHMPAWAPLIHRDLPGWLKAWSHLEPPAEIEKYISVLLTCWTPERAAHEFGFNEAEKVTPLALAALTNVWAAFDFASLHEFFPLARCTRDIALGATREGSDNGTLPEDLKNDYLAPLGAALIEVAENAREMRRNGDSDEAAKNNRILQGISELLVQLADTILTGSHHERVDFDWRFPDKIDGLESSFVADWQPDYVVEAP